MLGIMDITGTVSDSNEDSVVMYLDTGGKIDISEEVQQGCWRTGKMFGIEHYDIIPDGIIMGKSVGASLTLGCFMARSEIKEFI